jgi:hypothetical protein
MGEAAWCHLTLPAMLMAAGPTWANAFRRREEAGHLPATVVAARPCRHWPRRHVPRVAWARVPPLAGGVF